MVCVCLMSGLVACGSSERRSGSSTLIVLDHSIAGVALGAQRSDVDRLLGRGNVLRTSDQKPPEPPAHVEDVLYPNGLEVDYVSRSASSRAHGRAALLITSALGFQTRGGVGVGSSAAKLRAVAGVTCGNLLGLDCQHGGHHYNARGTWFALSAPGGVITRIVIEYGH